MAALEPVAPASCASQTRQALFRLERGSIERRDVDSRQRPSCSEPRDG